MSMQLYERIRTLNLEIAERKRSEEKLFTKLVKTAREIEFLKSISTPEQAAEFEAWMKEGGE